jgi:ribosomal protein S18 acetylase RimI-like enzyme
LRSSEAVIRPFGLDDTDAYRALRLEALRLHPEAFGQAVEEAEAADIADAIRPRPPDAVFAAFLPGLLPPQGMTALHRQRGRKHGHKGTIWGVYVRSAARGQGLGRLLLEHAVATARGTGLEWLHLTVSSEALAARALYESLGFAAYGTVPKGLKLAPGRYVDEVLMALDLRRS